MADARGACPGMVASLSLVPAHTCWLHCPRWRHQAAQQHCWVAAHSVSLLGAVLAFSSSQDLGTDAVMLGPACWRLRARWVRMGNRGTWKPPSRVVMGQHVETKQWDGFLWPGSQLSRQVESSGLGSGLLCLSIASDQHL